MLGGGPGLGLWFGSSLGLRSRLLLLRCRPGLRSLLRSRTRLRLGLRLRPRLLLLRCRTILRSLLRCRPGLGLRLRTCLGLWLRLRTRLRLYGLWPVLWLGGT